MRRGNVTRSGTTRDVGPRAGLATCCSATAGSRTGLPRRSPCAASAYFAHDTAGGAPNDLCEACVLGVAFPSPSPSFTFHVGRYSLSFLRILHILTFVSAHSTSILAMTMSLDFAHSLPQSSPSKPLRSKSSASSLREAAATPLSRLRNKFFAVKATHHVTILLRVLLAMGLTDALFAGAWRS